MPESAIARIQLAKSYQDMIKRRERVWEPTTGGKWYSREVNAEDKLRWQALWDAYLARDK